MTPIDAAHATVHDYPGGSESLAPRIGMRSNILRNKVNHNNETNHLTLSEASKLMALTGDRRILDALAAEQDCVVVPATCNVVVSDMAVLELVAKVWMHNGDVGRAVNDALADGRITKLELEDIKQSIYRVEQAMHTMLSRITGMAE